MDYYTLTYRLDGQGSDTIVNVAYFWQIYDIVDEHYEDIVKAIIEQEGSPELPTELNGFFAGCEKITEISFGNVDTSEVEDMSYLFNGCKSLVSLDISNFNTSNVIYMVDMFSYCVSLTSLDLSNFNTNNVTTTRDMFYGGSSLETIFVSDLWNNSSVTESGDMFDGCTSLVGAVPYNPSKVDITMANYTTGYFTYKSIPIGPFIGEKYPLPPFGV